MRRFEYVFVCISNKQKIYNIAMKISYNQHLKLYAAGFNLN